MSALKSIFGIIAIAGLSYFAPGIGTAIAAKLGITSGFLASAIGSVVLAAGLYGIQTLLMGGGRGTDMEASRVNVRLPEPPRWLAAGEVRMGGGVLFAEFDDAGNFWFIIAHADSILTSAIQYYLDDLPVTLDGSGYVQNKEFRLKSNKDKDPAEIDGEGNGYIQIWTTTHTESNPTPPAVSALAAAFPGVWTSDHKLVGTTYTVVKMAALPIEHRFKIYKWRGAIGVGEPAVSIAGEWSNVYDPRDGTQVLGDRTTYKPTNNAALIWAWFRTHRYGRRKSESSINWDRVAEQANICDQTVSGLDGNTPRYRCGIAIPENKQRVIAEQEILMSMDAQIVFDDNGKTWCRAGAWYTPTLSLNRNRDIIAMESVEARNGESDTQGVIVRYTDPAARYTVQPSAAWLNPLYYVPGEAPQFLTVDILPCHDHNQAMRLAKAIGMRSQPLHKIAPTVGLRGLRARQERIAALNYDNTFAGDYEIVTPVEVDSTGILCGMGMVPVDEDRWTLLAGEEKAKPVVDPTETVVMLNPPTGIVAIYTNGRIEVTFNPPVREDLRYEFEYILTSDIASDVWSSMSVQMSAGTAISGFVASGNYSIRARSVSPSGRTSAWSTTSTIDAVPFNPSSLFTGGTKGIILIADDLSNLYSDSAGTTGAVIDGPVGSVRDLSPNAINSIQATAANRPLVKRDENGKQWLLFDGSNDSLATATIDFTATDKITIFAALMPTVGVAGVLTELSVSSSTNPGSFMIQSHVPSADRYRWTLRGSSSTAFDAASPVVPHVMSVVLDIGGAARADEIKPRIDGVIPALTGSGSANAGTGNFRNDAIYIGARAGASTFYAGRLYALLVVGKTCTADEIANTEAYLQTLF